jgi:hypothetical protein
MKKKFYYDVHVFLSRQDGYSIGIEIESARPLTEDQVIEFAADCLLFTDDGDQNHVDYVEEIDEEQYKLLTA